MSHMLGLGFCYHLGYHYDYWHRYYACDPYYSNYYVGWGHHHYHWGTHFYHPLNYSSWWYPDAYTYATPTYIYVNDQGDYSPYPSTVVITSPNTSPSAGSTKPAEESTETLIARHVTLGDFYFKERRYRESAESYLRAIAYAPEDAALHFVLADSLFAMGDYHYAAFIIKKAVNLDPAMVFAEADKRDFYKDPKDFAKQMADLEKYVVDKPFDEAALLVLAYNLKFSKQAERATETFEKLLTLSTENETATLFLDALKTAGEAGAKGASPTPDKKRTAGATTPPKGKVATPPKPKKKINDSGDA